LQILRLAARAAIDLRLRSLNLWMLTTVPICPVLAGRVFPFSGFRRGKRLRRFRCAFFGPREGVGRAGQEAARETHPGVSWEER
jgi:hypothetical protein